MVRDQALVERRLDTYSEHIPGRCGIILHLVASKPVSFALILFTESSMRYARPAFALLSQ